MAGGVCGGRGGCVAGGVCGGRGGGAAGALRRSE